MWYGDTLSTYAAVRTFPCLPVPKFSGVLLDAVLHLQNSGDRRSMKRLVTTD